MFAFSRFSHLRVLLIAGLIAATLSSFVSLRAAAQSTPMGRPILFVHGWCGSAYDWAPVYAFLFPNLPSGMYTNKDVYEVEYDIAQNAFGFFLIQNPLEPDANKVNLTSVQAYDIPSTARFFVIEFVDPIANSTVNTDVAKISILNKADEISKVIKQIHCRPK